MKLGIDIGSISLKIALLDKNDNILEASYIRHKGNPLPLLLEKIKGFPDEILLGWTGTGTKGICEFFGISPINEVIAQATATSKLNKEIRTIIEIGGSDSKLINLSGDGSILDFSTNTICAAGCGSFLDQQASRMHLSIEEFSEASLKSEKPPRIAGRCSVFAKTDMIHLQQEATPIEDIIAGLCFAFARNFKSVIGKGKDIAPPVSFQGGVAANKGMQRAFKEVLGIDIVILEHFATMGAIGAALLAKNKIELKRLKDLKISEEKIGLEPLSLIAPISEYKDKIKTYPRLPTPDSRLPTYIGIDIGSVSTNVVAIDENKKVVARRYLQTASRPIEAVCQGLDEIGKEIKDYVEVCGCGTTGSGRYMIADFVGGDIVKNEITAQARAAYDIDPNVDTIFEIGGQDSKFIGLENGCIVDFEMNKVCAAGTGSFLEEQAERLGINIKEEFANLAFQSDSPLALGERCTVFMETDIISHQQKQAEKKDIVAGLSYSIVHNYLNRVVGEKKVGNKIFFQGGTAANLAVTAAFEKVCGKRIFIPENHDVTGAIGVAIIAKESNIEKTRFKGFDLKNRKYSLSSFECKGCPNSCEIKKVSLEGEEALFYGARCEKYERKSQGSGVRSQESRIPDLFAEREDLLLNIYEKSQGSGVRSQESKGKKPIIPPSISQGSGVRSQESKGAKVGIPRALFFYEFFPFFKAFFTELGFSVVFSEKTNKSIIHKGVEGVSVDTCFPIKLTHGHILSLLEQGIDYLFLPSVINLAQTSKYFSESYHCPYVQSIPYTTASTMNFKEDEVDVLQPVIRMRYEKKGLLKPLVEMGKALGISPERVKKALDIAHNVQNEFRKRIKERGEEILASLDNRSIVLIARSYNGNDCGLNLELPRKLRDLGVLAIPMDFLPLDSVDTSVDWPNMYWRSGQQILSACELVRKDERLFPIYLTNYGCGPDSFIVSFFKEKMEEKPHLIIEVDEHSADVGAITRCEAFLDSIENARKKKIEEGKRIKTLTIEKKTKRKIFIPYMSDHAYALQAAFKACGVNAEVMPESDEQTIYWGRKYTLGRECYPAIVTTGDMVKFTKRSDFNPKESAFFMGGSSGPCRFGQYSMLQRFVLDSLGYKDTPIYAPNQAKNFFKDLSMVGKDFEPLAWAGIVAIDILEKALYETRPYERVRSQESGVRSQEKGETERVYREYVKKVCEAIKQKKDLLPVMKEAASAFSKIPVYPKDKPVIGLVGEFFVRANKFSNENVIKKVEVLGGEVWSAPVNEWFLYRNFRRNMHSLLTNDYSGFIKTSIKNLYQVKQEARLSYPFHHLLRGIGEPSTSQVLEFARPYLHHSFEGEAIMSIGKAVDFVKKGLCGIINTIPFTCMPGTIATAILKSVSEDNKGLPILTIAYDGLSSANTDMRLEAFLYQARQYNEKMQNAKVSVKQK
ncbi:MAG: acyl-CoA dehydratase activase [bacterium]